MVSLAYNLSFYCYAAATTLTILIGLLYASRSKIMPYHNDALETTWDAIDSKYQFMLLALLNGGGYYGISTGLFMLVLLWIPFREGQVWAGYAIGIIGLIGALALGYIVYQVKTKTKGNPPFWVMVIVNLLLVVGLIGFHFAR